MKINAGKTTSNFQTTRLPDKVLNIQRREKLKALLITKFMKKYAIKDSEIMLKEEVSKFIEGDKLTEHELKLLDNKIKSLVTKKNDQDDLKQNLTNRNPLIVKNNGLDQLIIENKNDMNDNVSVVSKMSGVSKLSKYEKRRDSMRMSENLDDGLSHYSAFKETDRLNFNDEGDEWNAIAQHNQKQFEEEKIMKRYKDKEIKKKTREALDGQIKGKITKLKDENVKNRVFDDVLLQHVEYLNGVEKEKLKVVKDNNNKEKISRDILVKDEHKRKVEDFKKERKFDKKLSIYFENN